MVSAKRLLAIISLSGSIGLAALHSNNSHAIESGSPTKIKLTPVAVKTTSSDNFGSAVVMTSLYNAIGAPTTANNNGIVYLFNNKGQAKGVLKSSHMAGLFGASLDSDGKLLVVGAPSESSAQRGISSGAVYIYQQQDEEWKLIQRITSSDAMAGDFFGASVAIEGNNLFVGAHLQDGKGIDSGAVYHFTKQASGEFAQHKKLIPSSLKAGALFGNAMALDGDKLAIAAYGYDGKSPGGGAVYMYHEVGNDWKPIVKLEASKRKAFSEFGWSIDLNNNTLAVAAPYEDESGRPSGVVYVFNYTKNNWKFQDRLRYQDNEWKERFAAAVSLNDGYLLVGAPYGVGYLYQEIDNPDKAPDVRKYNSHWKQVEKIMGDFPYMDTLYSRAIDLSGGRALMGIPSGQDSRQGIAYIFKDLYPNPKEDK